MRRRPTAECSVHQEWCIPVAQRLHLAGYPLVEAGTEYRDEMLRLALVDHLKGQSI